VANLAGLTVTQLRELARRLGLRGNSSTDRAELVNALAPVVAESQPDDQPPAVPSGSSTVVFLPRDPQWAYTFWEISASDHERAQAAGAQQLCLRVEDVTGLPLGAAHAHTRQEVVVDARGSEWFLPVPLSGRDYRVELGYRLAGGGWLPLAVSAVAHVPAEGPSAVVADSFVPFTLEGPVGALIQPDSVSPVVHERHYRKATAGDVIRRRVGSELLHEQSEGSEGPEGVTGASGAGVWASGRSESGSGLPRQRSFWLVADAELIVYGATEPDATLSIGGDPVELDAEGRFRIHVPFRDGEQSYPIEAVAADGEQHRSIQMNFTRSTPAADVNTREQAVAHWF